MRLQQVFRQAGGSAILTSAHAIKNGGCAGDWGAARTAQHVDTHSHPSCLPRSVTASYHQLSTYNFPRRPAAHGSLGGGLHQHLRP